ncbi:hypothetical protein DEJ49_03715 [Streptomyces venezuelae]|uniref:Uncharacterized protein n=1 Tax=Streptomyces venezuelae TaxID=54571 RepID=A0A5P2CBV3_STRVZ|nr:hypothetical protein DEJ49_03715 [Streptomyces venezuelae]
MALADRNAALGHTSAETEAERTVRRAVGDAVPHLLTRWDEALDVERFVLAAPAAAHRPGLEPPVVSAVRLPDLPAPADTDRVTTVALMRELLDEEGSDVAVAALAGHVMREVGRSISSL